MAMDAGSDENMRLKRIFEADRSALPPDGGTEFNRLIFAASPYLLQHADNPVDWYEWGDGAFEWARTEDRPIFLSIGYATCHWCHVMAHESFEDPEVAAVLNRDFVAIKVDREERPDIDETYMRVAQLMNGSGGWPLNVCLTPEREPFFVATYIPKHSRGGMPGLVEILGRIADVWKTRRELIRGNCDAILDSLRRLSAAAPGEIPGEEPLRGARRLLAAMFDGAHGGFGQSPKFPMPLNISFLLRYGRRFGDSGAIAMAVTTLEAIRSGGIFDQAGFGLHRYSVDNRWLVPHFEKMLYDQALVALAAVEAFQCTGRGFLLEMAEEICDFVLRELSAPEGGFYSALDADSEGEEGRYYVWTPDQVRSILGQSEGEICCRFFDVSEGGNFEGANVLSAPVSPDDFARSEGLTVEGLLEKKERWRNLLLAERKGRVRPFRDEKIVTSWNGLMIAALARLYSAGGGKRFIEAAEAALARINRDLRVSGGRLLRSIHRGEGRVAAFLEDYAALLTGVLALYEATLEKRYLDEACLLARDMLRLFSGDGPGLHDTGNDAETVLLRGHQAYDGVIPSGNGLAAAGLVRLGRIVDDERLTESGEEIVRAFIAGAESQPTAHLQTLMALDLLRGPVVEVTISEGGKGELHAMLSEIARRFVPGLVLKKEPAGLDGMTAGVCAAGACRPRVASPGELGRLLDGIIAEIFPASAAGEYREG